MCIMDIRNEMDKWDVFKGEAGIELDGIEIKAAMKNKIKFSGVLRSADRSAVEGRVEWERLRRGTEERRNGGELFVEEWWRSSRS